MFARSSVNIGVLGFLKMLIPDICRPWACGFVLAKYGYRWSRVEIQGIFTGTLNVESVSDDKRSTFMIGIPSLSLIRVRRSCIPIPQLIAKYRDGRF